MKTELIVLSVDHYSMQSDNGLNQGLSVRILGGRASTNNKFGIDVVKVQVEDYNELEYLKRFEQKLPAKFKANQSIVMVKDRNGNEKGGIQVANLEYINSVEIIDQKVKA